MNRVLSKFFNLPPGVKMMLIVVMAMRAQKTISVCSAAAQGRATVAMTVIFAPLVFVTATELARK